MFLIELTYKKRLEDVDRCLEAHAEFLDKKYSEGSLICSGRKNPRDGGIILANVATREAVDAMISQDPFNKEQIADYRIIEFTPTKFDKRFECFTKR